VLRQPSINTGEKEELDKRRKNQEKKRLRQAREEACAALASVAVTETSRPSSTAGAVATALRPKSQKLKRKGVKLRKHAVIRGIRITDAASKQQVKEILAAEEAMRALGDSEMVDEDAKNKSESSAAAGVKKGKNKKQKSGAGGDKSMQSVLTKAKARGAGKMAMD
jgi:hypothetical protein